VGAVYADHFAAQHDRDRTFGISTRGKRPHLREDIVLATKLHGKMHDGPGGQGLSRKAILEQRADRPRQLPRLTAFTPLSRARNHLYFGAVHQLKAAERGLDDHPMSVFRMWSELDGTLLDFWPHAQLGPGHDHSEAAPPTLTELWRALPDIDMP
jgi:hypothetical protein